MKLVICQVNGRKCIMSHNGIIVSHGDKKYLFVDNIVYENDSSFDDVYQFKTIEFLYMTLVLVVPFGNNRRNQR